MSDPTNAEEFRLPSGEVMWIDPAAVEAAKSRETESMATSTKVGEAKDLKEAPQDGLYQIGRGVFRYRRGDKIPGGAVHLKDGKPLSAASAKKGKGKTAPSETEQSSGPDETT